MGRYNPWFLLLYAWARPLSRERTTYAKAVTLVLRAFGLILVAVVMLTMCMGAYESWTNNR